MEINAYYKTKQKDLIMDCLVQNKDRHVTAEEIIAALTAGKTPVGKTTVYRYLDRLVSQGIVRKYFIEGGKSACYQYMEQGSPCNEHFHLKCTDCGQLFHLKCEYMGDMDSHIKDHHNFTVDHSKTVLYGRCGTCAGNPGGSRK